MFTGTAVSGVADAVVCTLPAIAPPLASAKSMPVVDWPTATGTGVPLVTTHESAGHAVPTCNWSRYPEVLEVAT